jgi:hypothetical protein
MDKQLNARIKPDLHTKIKTLSSDTQIIMNTLVETLLEIGLKHYQSGSVSIDSDRYLTQDDLKTFEDRLKKLESLIGNSATGQTEQVESFGTSVPILEISEDAIAIETNQDVHNTDGHLYPVGSKVSKFELSKYLGFHHTNYSTKGKKLGLSTEEYVNRLAAAKGEKWQELIEGITKYFVRIG